ncbi:MAG: VWA domain-containing protein, partial [Acidobacteria bacterium]|nr:VWA domain-containing protein [Acidobacteriota bacterium]
MTATRRTVLFAALVATLATVAAAPPEHPREVRSLLDRVASGGKPLSDSELQALLDLMPPQEVDVSLVMVSAVVTDRRGRAVPGLAARDFRVLEEGELRPLAWFSEEQGRSFRVVLLVDVSGSMDGDAQIEGMVAALRPIAREVGIADRVKLLAFAGRGPVEISDWTNRSESVLETIRDIPRGGRTALADALVMAAGTLPKAPIERQAIVLVTDGLDNASHSTAAEAIDAARRIGVPVYVLGLADEARVIQEKRAGNSPLMPLRAIADQTGGRYFQIVSAEDADAAARRIREDLRHSTGSPSRVRGRDG